MGEHAEINQRQVAECQIRRPRPVEIVDIEIRDGGLVAFVATNHQRLTQRLAAGGP